MLPPDIVKTEDIAPALECLSRYIDSASPEQKARINRLIALCQEKCGDDNDAMVMVAIAIREGAASSAVEGISLDWMLHHLELAIEQGVF